MTQTKDLKPEQRQQLAKLFRDNAFFLLENADRILTNKRMSLSPVAVQNGLAYSGAFPQATLGAYLEWWLNDTVYSTVTDPEQGDMLIWLVSGSPLSGSHACSGVNRQGEVKTVKLPEGFRSTWKSFCKYNNQYQKAIGDVEPYNLQQVIDILHQANEADSTSTTNLDSLFLRARIDHLEMALKRKEEQLRETINNWHQYAMSMHTDELNTLYRQHLDEVSTYTEKLEAFRGKRSQLRFDFKEGKISQQHYQAAIRELEQSRPVAPAEYIGGEGTSLPKLPIREVQSFLEYNA